MEIQEETTASENSSTQEWVKGENPFSSVIEASTDAIIVADEDEQILIWNVAAERLFGYSKEEVVGKDFISLIVPPSYRCMRSKAYERAIHEKRLAHQGRIIEAEGMRKDGSLFPLEHTVSMWQVSGEARFVAILRDVSENNATKTALRRLNEELEERVRKRTEALERSNADLENFAYIISHDLKTPLRSVHQLSQWIRMDYEASLDEEGLELLELLIDRVKRMHKLIENVLAFSRVGRTGERRTMVDVTALIEDIVKMIAPPPNIRVEGDGPLPKITGVPARIKGLFMNLIDNAVKFNDKNRGRITVRCQPDGSQWLFSVADNGPGIDRKYHESIFEIFQSVGGDKGHGGTGFGLSYAKKIVETAGGSIWVKSYDGDGATFYFTWPRQEEDP